MMFCVILFVCIPCKYMHHKYVIITIIYILYTYLNIQVVMQSLIQSDHKVAMLTGNYHYNIYFITFIVQLFIFRIYHVIPYSKYRHIIVL